MIWLCAFNGDGISTLIPLDKENHKIFGIFQKKKMATTMVLSMEAVMFVELENAKAIVRYVKDIFGRACMSRAFFA